MNRYNSGGNDFRLINERPLEGLNLPLYNAFSLVMLRLPVPEISSCKEKVIFNRLLSHALLAYSHLSQIADKWQTRFQEKRMQFQKEISTIGVISRA